jgi:lipoprotein-anchoring transpeptidase ErfK/SrfK
MAWSRSALLPTALAVQALLSLAQGACNGNRGAAPSSDASTADSTPVTPSPAAPDAGVAQDAGADAEGGTWVGATRLDAPIYSEMESFRGNADREVKVIELGTLRWGEKTPAIPGVREGKGCPEGWYALVAGGYVCGRDATSDLDQPRFKAAAQPDLEGPLPYRYAINLTNGTPLYRHVPTRLQRVLGEPWRFSPRPIKRADDPDAAADPDAGDDGGLAEDDLPWYRRQITDGGQLDASINDIKRGEGAVAERMAKGFYLSIDRDLDALGEKWWQTVSGYTAPAYRVIVAKPGSEFHGVWLGKDDASFPTKNAPARRIDNLPVAFVTNGYGSARRYTLDNGRKQATAAGPLDRFQAVGLTGEKTRVDGVDYWESDEGWWMRAADFTRTDPGSRPDHLGEHEKWIDVNLKRQTLVAFEGATAVYATMFSSGRNEHETTPGIFRIRAKHLSATMDGDADVAADGPYSIEDVPYIQYFHGGYALHGAFWHSAFGFVKSHGCVNLAPWDAKNLFGWTEPTLPEGWHSVVATKDRPGTRVIVHERGPHTCEGPDIKPARCPEP